MNHDRDRVGTGPRQAEKRHETERRVDGMEAGRRKQRHAQPCDLAGRLGTLSW